MNLLNLIRSCYENVCTVSTTFHTGKENFTYKTYTYIVPKAWNVKLGDRLVVPVFAEELDDERTELKVVTVDEVHTELDIDTDAEYSIRWAVALVPTDWYKTQVSVDRKTLKEVEKKKRKHQQKQMLAALTGETGELSLQLATLEK